MSLRSTLILLLVLAQAGPARADDDRAVPGEAAEEIAPAPPRVRRLIWRWPRVRVWEYGLTAAAFGTLAYVQFGTHTTRAASWDSPILFDEPFRDAVRLGGYDDRKNADLASDVLWFATWGFPLMDSLLVALALDRNLDVAWQIMAINAQVYGVVAATTRIIHKTVKRARPAAAECRRDPGYSEVCGGAPSSFFSGHTAMTAASAGLTCAHHQFLPLYGNRWADRAACAGAILTSVGTGLARIMSDRHYVSDVLAGAAYGFLVGYMMPWLLHYRHGSPGATRSGAAATHLTLSPRVEDDYIGLSLAGLVW